MKSNQNKRQHYIPRFIFKDFINSRGNVNYYIIKEWFIFKHKDKVVPSIDAYNNPPLVRKIILKIFNFWAAGSWSHKIVIDIILPKEVLKNTRDLQRFWNFQFVHFFVQGICLNICIALIMVEISTI